MNKLYHNPNVHPRPEGSTIQSPQPTTTEKPQNYGNPTNTGAGIMGMLRNWFYGSSYQENRNQGNTYNNNPLEQKKQNYVVSGYSGKTQALGGTSEELDTRSLRPNGIYNPYLTGQKAGVTADPNANIGQVNFNAQRNTNAHPLSTTTNPYEITMAQTGNTGGFNGNITIQGNTNVGMSAIRGQQNNAIASGTVPHTNTTNTINQTQNKFSTDLPVTRQEFSSASKKVGWKVANKIHAAIPPTDPRWNMKQNLYQKAMESADPLIEIQNNPQLKPADQYMQQKGSNITPLLNYDAFNGIFGGNEMQDTKESNYMPFIIAAGALGAVFILGRKI
jgi:hypothetical protein|tara:strand:+ start:2874 stop:3872 length:999 start_codon:yes stop_codon:yes gene_type:complete